MAVPVLALTLHLAHDVAHHLAAGALGDQAVLWPLGQVLLVECQVELRT